MKILTITHERPANPGRRRRQQPPKTRSFQAVKLAHVCAGMLWEGGETQDAPIRPVWMALAATDTQLRPFLANMRLGKPAELYDPRRSQFSRDKPTRFELLRSAGYSFTSSTMGLPDGNIGEVVTAALDSIMVLDPGLLDPETVSFLALPPRWWVETEQAAFRSDTAAVHAVVDHIKALKLDQPGSPILPQPASFDVETLLDLVPVAAYVLAYIDRRTRRPLFMTPAFALQLYVAGLAFGVLSLSNKGTENYHEPQISGDDWRFARHRWAKTFKEEDTSVTGLMPGIACKTSHDQLDRLLASEVKRYANLSNR